MDLVNRAGKQQNARHMAWDAWVGDAGWQRLRGLISWRPELHDRQERSWRGVHAWDNNAGFQ
eukprot:1161804-Pelagomonas_calceolata.AAC.1